MNNNNYKIVQSTFFDYLGFKRLQDDNGAVVISVDVQEIHKDENGHIASGIHYTLLDVALGTAVSEKENGFTLTIDLHVQLFDLNQCEKLICRGYPVNINGNIGNGRGDIFDENGVLIASGMATFKVIQNNA
ncbi:PaaI family thioesterase [Sporosarcina jiandibaonis]|uniref:PaaI family thioesterase n=1 Tax=Sporosarcina jiandibaonis TaxID=2715535 RepID=UPI001557BE33|nr:PaaI family thioesterase [Sporosarcina jiandibaonis]